MIIRAFLILICCSFLMIPQSLASTVLPKDVPTAPTNQDKAILNKISVLEEKNFNLEKKLEAKTLPSMEEKTLELHKKLDDRAMSHVSYMDSGMTTLGIFTGILALAGIGITFMLSRAYRREIEIKKLEFTKVADEIAILKKDATEYVNSIKKDRTELDQILTEAKTSDKPSTEVMKAAHKIEKEPDTLSSLRALAFIAQDNKNWEEAHIFWKKILDYEPKNRSAIFGYVLASGKLFDKQANKKEAVHIIHEALGCLKNIKEGISSVSLLNNWALLLIQSSAFTTSTEERDRVLNEAENKLKRATQIEQNNVLTLSNLGTLFVRRASITEQSEDKSNFFDAAEKCYKQITNLQPNHTDILGSWGILLNDKAKLVEDKDEQLKLWQQAEQKFEQAIKADQNNVAALNSWGVLYYDQSLFVNEINEKNVLWDKAEAKYQQALAIEHSNPNALMNYGLLYVLRAEHVNDVHEKNKLWDKAEEIYSNVIRDNPKDFEVLANWGILIYNRANVTQDVNTRAILLGDAENKYKMALSFEPNFIFALANLGTTLIKRASDSTDLNYKNGLLRQAEEKLHMVLATQPNNTSIQFNLACIASLQNNLDVCLNYLKRCDELNLQNLFQKIVEDKDFDNVRSKQEFQDFLKTLEEKEQSALCK